MPTDIGLRALIICASFYLLYVEIYIASDSWIDR